MSEKIFSWLLRLYPAHFREAYHEEALQLFRDRLRDERSLLARLRLWCDLFTDFLVSVPHEYLACRTEGHCGFAHSKSGCCSWLFCS